VFLHRLDPEETCANLRLAQKFLARLIWIKIAIADAPRSGRGQGFVQWSELMKPIARTAIATSAAVCATLFSFNWSEQRGISLSIESAQARIGRPLTPFSVAGVSRRHYRRAAYGYGAGAGLAAGAVGAAAVGATSGWGYYGGGPYVGTGWGYYGGYPGGYYDGYANRSYVTGRPTLFPRYYGGTYAAEAYPAGYNGVYANRSYVTGRPTLIPRYYGGGSW
jgi:hypothetical protein